LTLKILAAGLWSIYFQFGRRLFRRFPGAAFDRGLVREITESAESYAKYRKTLAVQDLGDAISHFLMAKSLTPMVRRESEYRFLLEGNGSRQARNHLLERVRTQITGKALSTRFRRLVLRPGLLLQERKIDALTSGFVIRATLQNFGDLQMVLKEIGALSTTNNFEVNRLTLFLPKHQLHGLVLRNLEELLPTLESAGEVMIADELCCLMEDFDLFHSHRRNLAVVAKLYLIANRDLPSRMLELGWHTHERVRPVWTPLPFRLTTQSESATHEDSSSGVLADATNRLASATAIVRDALVFLGDTIVSKNTLLEIDDAANPSHDFVAGRQFDVVGTHVNVGKAVVRIPKDPETIYGSAILLSTRADINWFHWLIETLPKLFIADSSIDPGVPLLISSRIPPSAKEALALVSKRRVIEFEPAKGAKVDELYVISPVIFNPDTLHMWLSKNSNKVDLEAIKALRTAVLEKVLPAEEHVIYPDKLFVSRRTGARGVVNSLSIRRMLTRRGFVSIEPETLSFTDQVLAFNKARIIVMVGGASMANLIFCRNGAKVIFLSSTLVLPNRLVSVLAYIAGAKVTRVAGPVVGGMFRLSLLEKIHSHYRIPISKLKKSLSTLSLEER
jgi:capsular polysaccharide biosynthesis protein